MTLSFQMRKCACPGLCQFPAAAVTNYHKRSGLKLHKFGTSLVVQWLRFHAPTVGGADSIPGWLGN